ncbi:hypothetical protein KY290_017449 [Solanum tuberosum]|uniref:Uncharacterized protein n=2 Tax=Solanum tuberosum TaxID=4113 RepID=A0ABQ7VD78_SOLTU|nr:hypothetical protein KY290_017449 [Solanum tuberosum]
MEDQTGKQKDNEDNMVEANVNTRIIIDHENKGMGSEGDNMGIGTSEEEKPPDPPNNMEGEGSSTNNQEETKNGESEQESRKQEQLNDPGMIAEKGDEDADEYIEENITVVSKEGDLSPRHTKEMRMSRNINMVAGTTRSTRSSLAKPLLSK